jgi:hypothetical protein
LTGTWFFSPTAAIATYSYDPAGNRATTAGFAPGASNVLTTYTSGQGNRLRSIALSPGTTYPHGTIVTNLYDGNGLRQGYQDSTGRTTLTYDGQNVYRRDVQSIGGVQRYTNEPGDYSPLISHDPIKLFEMVSRAVLPQPNRSTAYCPWLRSEQRMAKQSILRAFYAVICDDVKLVTLFTMYGSKMQPNNPADAAAIKHRIAVTRRYPYR